MLFVLPVVALSTSNPSLLLICFVALLHSSQRPAGRQREPLRSKRFQPAQQLTRHAARLQACWEEKSVSENFVRELNG